jgi:ankyrin repeat protein
MNWKRLLLSIACANATLALRPVQASDKDAALLVAAEGGDAATVQSLLQQGACLSARTSQGWSPLILAVKRGDVEMTKRLVEAGADVNDRSQSKMGSTVLCWAVSTGNLKLIEFLLDHGAGVNGRSRDGNFPLFYAATTNDLPLARLLLAKDAQVNQFGPRSQNGILCTPLCGAAAHGYFEMMELLLSHGADLERRDNTAATLLMQMAKEPRPDVVRWLIQKGANVNARTQWRYTALTFAEANGRAENVSLLLAAGADPGVQPWLGDEPYD